MRKLKHACGAPERVSRAARPRLSLKSRFSPVEECAETIDFRMECSLHISLGSLTSINVLMQASRFRIRQFVCLSAGMAGGGMGQAMGGYYGAAYGPLGASMAAAAAAAAQQTAISAALTTPGAQLPVCAPNSNAEEHPLKMTLAQLLNNGGDQKHAGTPPRGTSGAVGPVAGAAGGTAGIDCASIHQRIVPANRGPANVRGEFFSINASNRPPRAAKQYNQLPLTGRRAYQHVSCAGAAALTCRRGAVLKTVIRHIRGGNEPLCVADSIIIVGDLSFERKPGIREFLPVFGADTKIPLIRRAIAGRRTSGRRFGFFLYRRNEIVLLGYIRLNALIHQLENHIKLPGPDVVTKLSYNIRVVTEMPLTTVNVGSSMDAMSKYSLEAEKYRGAYSMYPDPSRSYLDSAALSKAYMYMDQQQQRSYPMDISKMYTEASAAAMAGLSSAPSSISPRSPADSPDINVKTIPQDRIEAGSSSSSASNASPGALSYYQGSSGLLAMPQYPGQYPQTGQSSGEFRRPLTVIF
ncbi:hypothetical protein EVAR_60463_1 [Eumeta japonica]|uniref:Uncharacterized protein n=1 Tax=Eumeta variegata TaxID=151549 RepID=A0A4C1Z4Q4_EUMVA|nr:hypothetical protein EVAR_60463_1 [Eumeta japonica]